MPKAITPIIAIAVVAVVGALAVLGAGAYLLIVNDKDDDSTRICGPPIQPSSRAPDAQALVDESGDRLVLAQGAVPDATLRSIFIDWPAESLYIFLYTGTAADKPPVIYVAMSPEGELQAQTNLDADPDYEDMPLDLTALKIGPSSVADIVLDRVEGTDRLLLTLVAEECDLIWHVVGKMQDGQEFRGAVSNSTETFEMDD